MTMIICHSPERERDDVNELKNLSPDFNQVLRYGEYKLLANFHLTEL